MLYIARRQILSGLILLSGLSVVPMAFAQTLSIPTPRVAIRGYDPVSYFEVHHPEQGFAGFTANFDDTTYWFTSAAHRDLFVANPDKYAPQYDGFCAMAVAIGQKLDPNPETWAINDDKLYVFGEPPPGQPPAVPFFQQHTAEVLKAGGENWPAVRKLP